MATKAGRATLNKEEFIKKSETNWKKSVPIWTSFANCSCQSLDGERLEEAFNNLYDAKIFGLLRKPDESIREQRR